VGVFQKKINFQEGSEEKRAEGIMFVKEGRLGHPHGVGVQRSLGDC